MEVKKFNAQLKTKYYEIDSFDKYEWDKISENVNLTSEIIKEYSDKINWSRIRCHYNFEYNFIEKNLLKFDFDVLVKNCLLDENLILKGWDNFFKLHLINYQLLTGSIIDQLLKDFHQDDFILRRIITVQNLNNHYLEEIISQLGENQISNDFWDEISKNYLSEDFIIKYDNKLNWKLLSRYQDFTVKFLKEFIERIDWEEISAYQKLNEDFIIDNKSNLNWQSISSIQKITPRIVELCFENINQNTQNWINILSNNKFKEDLILKIFERTDWNEDMLISAAKYQILGQDVINLLIKKIGQYNQHWIYYNQKFNKDFIYKNLDNFDFNSFADNKFLSDELVLEFQTQISNHIGKSSRGSKLPDKKSLENLFWKKITSHYNINKDLRKQYRIKVNTGNWFYKSVKIIKQIIFNSHYYETYDSFFYAYFFPNFHEDYEVNQTINFRFHNRDIWRENFYVGPILTGDEMNKGESGTFSHKIVKVKVNYEDVRKFERVRRLPVTKIQVIGIIERPEFTKEWNNLAPRRIGI